MLGRVPDRVRIPHRATVLRTEPLTAHMVRIVFGGDGLSQFPGGEYSDRYVKLQVPEPDAGRTRTRTYTVRDWDGDARLLTIDFVVHGAEGVAGPWAAAARPGDELEFFGPGGGYTPDPEAEWHLLVGDASVIPAISLSLARIPAGRPVWVVIEVTDESEQQPLSCDGELHLSWVYATPGQQPEILLDAVRALDLPFGRGHAFVHGEASAVRQVRRHLLVDRGLDPDALSASGYWKYRSDDERWREQKAEWRRLAEADVAAPAG